jgi:protein tyrosine phosphatase
MYIPDSITQDGSQARPYIIPDDSQPDEVTNIFLSITPNSNWSSTSLNQQQLFSAKEIDIEFKGQILNKLHEYSDYGFNIMGVQQAVEQNKPDSENFEQHTGEQNHVRPKRQREGVEIRRAFQPPVTPVRPQFPPFGQLSPSLYTDSLPFLRQAEKVERGLEIRMPNELNSIKDDFKTLLYKCPQRAGDLSQFPNQNCKFGLANPEKNRNGRVLPFDSNCITKQNFPSDLQGELPDNFYVNGSQLIDGNFITQGPMSGTVDDFWRFVDKTGADTIVMCTDLCDDDEENCVQYWPRLNEYFEAGELKIKCSEFQEYSLSNLRSVTLRTLYVSGNNTTGEGKMIRQFHIKKWKDMSSIPTEEIFIFFHKFLSTSVGGKPIIFHCMAGVGRSGLLSICYYLYNLHRELVEKNKSFKIVVNLLVSYFRKYCRMGMIGSSSQYETIFNFIHYLMEQEPKTI